MSLTIGAVMAVAFTHLHVVDGHLSVIDTSNATGCRDDGIGDTVGTRNQERRFVLEEHITRVS